MTCERCTELEAEVARLKLVTDKRPRPCSDYDQHRKDLSYLYDIIEQRNARIAELESRLVPKHGYDVECTCAPCVAEHDEMVSQANKIGGDHG